MSQINLLLPEITVALIGLVAFFFTLLNEKASMKLLYPVMFSLGIVAIFTSILSLRHTGILFFNTYQIDFFSQSFKLILIGCLVLIFSISDRTPSLSDKVRPEYFLFLSTATLGMMLLTSANELIVLFISLELASVSQYILVPLRRGQVLNAEAGIKYLLFGGAASAITLYGLSFIFGIAQSTFFSEIAQTLPELSQQPVFYVGIFLTSAGFFFKLAAFPFHFWAPDVYEGASTQVTAFIATASKAAGVAVLLRILQYFPLGIETFTYILIFLSIISMTLGNLAAMIQKDMKRMLAYSSIAQAGYILAGLLAQSPQGFVAVIFYTIAYLIMNFAVFMVTARIASIDDNPGIKSFAGLADRSPLLALTLLIGLLSLAGIPPLAGFTGKWFIFSAAMEKGHWILVLIGVINSVVSLYYYLMVVKEAYLGKPAPGETPLNVDLKTRFLSYATIVALVILGVFPTILIQWAQGAVKP